MDARRLALPWHWFAIVCMLAIGIAQVDAAARFAAIVWDDSAITLGFARTLATHGEIRPSLLSDRVEGYSTPLWMLINAGAYLAIQSPDGLLRFATSASLALNFACLAMLFVILRRFAPVEIAGLLAAIWAAQKVTFYESINGMEHPLLVLLLLVAFWGYLGRASPRRYLAYVIASTLAVTVRWEALWFLMPFVIVTVRADGIRRLFAAEHLLWAGAFLGLSAFRLAYFGDLVPNTILAKASYPYTALDPSSRVVSRALAGLDIAAILFPLIAVTGALYAFCGLIWRRRNPADGPAQPRPAPFASGGACAALMVAAGVTFNIAVGQNYGPPARLFNPALPFAFVCAAACIDRCWPAVTRLVRHAFVAALLVLGIASAWDAYQEMAGGDGPRYMPLTTTANVASVVRPIDLLRRRAGLAAITVASPDMGGLMLYGDRMRIIDVALLCNRELARTGIWGTEDVAIGREQAHLIEVHAVWSAALYQADSFYQLYMPVIAQGIRFFVRRSLLPALAGVVREERFDVDGNTPHIDRTHFIYRHYQAHDLAINRRFGTFLLFNE